MKKTYHKLFHASYQTVKKLRLKKPANLHEISLLFFIQKLNVLFYVFQYSLNL